jgi:ribulose-5-phosphate 4-epimerase/fuculose-1-phosphate aldolase
MSTEHKTVSHQQAAPQNEETRRIIELADTPAARQLKVKLAAAYRILARKGMDESIAGHISLRVPGAPHHFWVNPFGLLFREVTAENLALINEQGQILAGWPLINYAGFCIHSAIHRARPDVHCAVHVHSPAGAAFSALGRQLEPLDQVACSFYEDHAVYHEYEGVVIDSTLANAMIEALGTKRALVLVNHGLLTCAATVEQALVDMLDLERSCALHLQVYATGQPPTVVPAEAARQARSVYTNPERWPFVWQTLMRDLARYETDFDPKGWGGPASVITAEMLRSALAARKM